ncbi:signal transduction histidine kinase [Halogeometricum borinquense DSM 11551]|uniref:histidine kinase n=2 Tax=Halogeometricum borinquense (strain ATCC 700274 / DSM 11551 / JCM 10706 / KCTC 4070 / PR3) TaxID=469382 RepID=L9USL3_HALBP|nr:GAF domain-containing sensor histidine kinase [Halogeometricum borinquense]ELY27707.1 signal transduction histidine kinase [Halogeometricum borinquense DSM 11551]
MRGISARTGGWFVICIGLLPSLYHLYNTIGLFAEPAQLTVELFPLVLSTSLLFVGVLITRGQFVGNQFVGRILAWMSAGVVALTILGGWVFVATVIRGFPLIDPVVPMLNVATAGALIGLLVGVYDARGLEQQRSLEQLNRINDTLRIATQELVSNSERSALEQAVCDRVIESGPYDAAWIGRYDPTDSRVRPVAWTGFDEEYFESLVVTVDDDPTGKGAGGRAIKSGEIQCIPNVFEDPTMQPWWDQFEALDAESLAVVPIRDDETVYGLISIYADRQNVFDEREKEVLSELGDTIGHAITSIETHEQLAERERELARQNQRLEEFTGAVSHDLRNPLNVAEGFLELAQEHGDEQYFDRVADALARMNELIEDLLTLAQQGTAIDEFDKVPLETVAEDAWETAGSPSATLRLLDDLRTVACDRSRLRELFENLFRNSREHAGSDVTIIVRPIDSGFAVEDDGPGIPAADRQEVFEAGYSTNEDGTGFGLNIVKSIAEAHGWTVSLAESPDGGVRFEFTNVEMIESEPLTF